MKRNYIKPESELIESTPEALLTPESINVGNGEVNDPSQVQSKGASFLFDDAEDKE